VTYNLDILKQELPDYIAAEGFAVFRGQPGSFEAVPNMFWDTEAHPEYQAYLNVAKVSGARVIIFAHREFEAEEIGEALDQMQDCELSHEQQRSMERSLVDLRAYVGNTCSIEMAFDHQGRLYIYELVTDWFQTYLDLSDLLISATAVDVENGDEDGTDSSFGGYYSKN
jgi:hypothetical protein